MGAQKQRRNWEIGKPGRGELIDPRASTVVYIFINQKKKIGRKKNVLVFRSLSTSS
jgi:hypothetical protein